MRKGRDAVCAGAAKLEHPRTRARSSLHMRFISSLHERPAADVEILGHGHVNEAARVAQRARDVAPAPHVLGENEVARPENEAAAFARLELEDPRGKENQLAPRGVVKILHVALRGLAKKNGVALEGTRHGPPGLAHRNLADLDRRFPRFRREYPEYAHANGTIDVRAARCYLGPGRRRARMRKRRSTPFRTAMAPPSTEYGVMPKSV